MILRAMFGGAVLISLMALTTEPWQVFALRTLQGCVTGTVAAATVFVASIVPKEEAGYRLGLLQMAIFLGGSIGPLFGGFVADSAGPRANFPGHGSHPGMLGIPGLALRGRGVRPRVPVGIPPPERRPRPEPRGQESRPCSPPPGDLRGPVRQPDRGVHPAPGGDRHVRSGAERGQGQRPDHRRGHPGRGPVRGRGRPDIRKDGVRPNPGGLRGRRHVLLRPPGLRPDPGTAPVAPDGFGALPGRAPCPR
ncbi:MAG: MFS transporter [Desulfobacterales bacterium]|nr:MFS transporter [Desulfobacterales bacterium]